MSGTKTRHVALPRRFLADLAELGQRIPFATVERKLHFASLLPIRACVRPGVGWYSIFLKAYAQVCATWRELRQVHLAFPRERLHEHPHPVVLTATSRIFDSKDLPFLVPMRPDTMGLLGVEAELRRCAESPPEEFEGYRFLMARTRWPRWVRRWLWWRTMNDGSQRAERIGTSAVLMSPSEHVRLTQMTLPVTTQLIVDGVEHDGTAIARLCFDQRILDGRIASLALDELEETLRYSILAELRYQQAIKAA